MPSLFIGGNLKARDNNQGAQPRNGKDLPARLCLGAAAMTLN
jgi:hypothetical protein